MLTDMTQGIELAWELPTSNTMMSLKGLVEKARYAAPDDRLCRRADDGAGEPVPVMAGTSVAYDKKSPKRPRYGYGDRARMFLRQSQIYFCNRSGSPIRCCRHFNRLDESATDRIGEDQGSPVAVNDLL
jgi:hypothetical protein